jgi:hypothetical protein
MEQLKVIAQRPHPVGSDENARVRNYLFDQLRAMGLNPVVQEATAAVHIHGIRWRRSARLKNIIARLPGTQSGKAILLAAHYDSVENSRGASDDGSGVVALLESARALKNSRPLKNDVLFIFTDAEEPGLLGSVAFVEQNPLEKKVGLVLNFEARGSHGATAMYEVSSNNSDLIREFGKSAEHPISNSFVYALSRILPNDTDFTIFKNAGIPGFSFAYADGLDDYHTYNDSLDSIDERSLQHSGSYAVSLVNHFGDLDLEEFSKSTGDRVYFDIFGKYLVSYPDILSKLLAILSVLLFSFLLFKSVRNKEATRYGVLLNCLRFTSSLLVTAIAVTLISKIMDWIPDGGYGPAAASLLPLGYLTLAMASFVAFYQSRRRRAAMDGMLAVVLLWTMLSAASGFFLTGASYVFQIPLFCVLIGMLLGTRALILSTIPAVILPTAVIYTAVIAMGPTSGVVPSILATLLFGLFVPVLDVLATVRLKWISGALFICGFVLLLVGTVSPRNAKTKPKPDYLVYAVDADSKEAFWITHWGKPDAWIGKVMGTKSNLSTFPQFFTTDSVKRYAPAPRIELVPPKLTVIEDRIDEVRKLKLGLRSPRRARCVYLWREGAGTVLNEKIDGIAPRSVFRFSPEIDFQILKSTMDGLPTTDWRWSHCGMDGGPVVFDLEVEPGVKFKLRVADFSDGFPESLKVEPRPEGLIPSEWGDRVIVSVSTEF